LKEIIFYGDDAFFYEFPAETEIYYAKEPLAPLEKDRDAIKKAIENPIASKRLENLVNENSHIAICFDDISVPLPAMKDDVRIKAAKVVIEKLMALKVKKDNILFICATGLHRKCTSKELSLLLGKKIFREFKHRIINHDAEDKENLVVLATTKEGYEVEINKFAAEADLIIYLNITFTPLNGGWKSIIVGLGSYKTIIPHHSPEVLKEASYMDPAVSQLHRIIWEMGKAIKDKVNVFTIEMVLNNNFFSGVFEKLYHPLGENNKKPAYWRRSTLSLFRIMPKFIKSYNRKKIKAGYKLIGVYAGDIEEVHVETLKLVKKQFMVPINKQYDILIYGVPNVTPYNVGSEMNPLLLHALTSGYLYNMYNGKSPLKKGGYLILSNPAYEKFDLKQHPSYKDFYYDILSKKPDIYDLKDLENKYLQNEEYLRKYRTSYAYHGLHAPIVYYWGVLGLNNIGKVVVAGAKNKNTLKILGYEYAKNLDEAIDISKKQFGENCSIAYFCIPPIFIAELKR
jgi:hypothetical protein